jgi:hypothetical protein
MMAFINRKRKQVIALLSFWLILCSLAGAQDPRITKIEKFLARYAPTSPLRGYEAIMVKEADKYGVDYRLYLALAGAESTWGKRFPKKSYNLTGISNGRARFSSLVHNIRFTCQTIGTKKWYRKYRKTKNLWDLVKVYKGVPPYERYLRSLRYTMSLIAAIPAAEEKIVATTNRVETPSLIAFNHIRYDQFANRTLNTIALTD